MQNLQDARRPPLKTIQSGELLITLHNQPFVVFLHLKELLTADLDKIDGELSFGHIWSFKVRYFSTIAWAVSGEARSS